MRTDRQTEGRTERQIKRRDKANILFSQLYEHAYRGNILVNIVQKYTKHPKKKQVITIFLYIDPLLFTKCQGSSSSSPSSTVSRKLRQR